MGIADRAHRGGSDMLGNRYTGAVSIVGGGCRRKPDPCGDRSEHVRFADSSHFVRQDGNGVSNAMQCAGNRLSLAYFVRIRV